MTQPIFIFSLPRSGSTLLQRILMNSGQAASLGETSLLLRLLGDDDLTARRAVYWEFLVDVAIDDMKRHWPGYANAYREGVRRLMLDIYAGLADGAPCFIDKTPRYSLIAEKIYQTFPDAKFIVLVRHPLAVAASMHTTSSKDFWFPEEYSIDLYQGFRRLHRFAQSRKEKIHLVRYEDLVTNPAKELDAIGHYLGWPNLPAALDKPLPPTAGGSLGDATGTKKFNAISTGSLNRWEQVYHNFYRKHWASKYISGERAEAMATYGYELPESISKSIAGGWLSGIKDVIMASCRRKRRITDPQWLPRSLEYYRLTHGIDVTWR